jgi:hypothetical protein
MTARWRPFSLSILKFTISLPILPPIYRHYFSAFLLLIGLKKAETCAPFFVLPFSFVSLVIDIRLTPIHGASFSPLKFRFDSVEKPVFGGFGRTTKARVFFAALRICHPV